MDKTDQKFHLVREAIFKEDTPGLHIYKYPEFFNSNNITINSTNNLNPSDNNINKEEEKMDINCIKSTYNTSNNNKEISYRNFNNTLINVVDSIKNNNSLINNDVRLGHVHFYDNVILNKRTEHSYLMKIRG